MPVVDRRVPADGWRVVELLTATGVTASKSEATRLIRGGGIYVNDRRITDEKERLTRRAGDRGPDVRRSQGESRTIFSIRIIAALTGRADRVLGSQ